jgi:hypothetical protein
LAEMLWTLKWKWDIGINWQHHVKKVNLH